MIYEVVGCYILLGYRRLNTCQGLLKEDQKKAGLAPGTLVHIGDHKTEKVKITIIDYDEGQLQEKELKEIEESLPLKDKTSAIWINIDGIYQLDIIEKIGKHFGIHPLIQEDIVNTAQRPKAEDFDDYVYIVLKVLYQDEDKLKVKSEQISLIIGSRGRCFFFSKRQAKKRQRTLKEDGMRLSYRCLNGCYS